MNLTITLIIVILTCVVSFTAFSNKKVIDDLIFYPPAISQRHQWYRFITCGFIHADFMHLAFNMFSFYLFGNNVEEAFIQLFPGYGKGLYLAMYLLALFVCLLPTYFKNKDNYYYRSLGASGAVSAVIFVGVFLEPLNKIYLFFIPVGIPGFIFGPLYLILSAYLSRKGTSHINHSAHFWGAIFGVAYFIIACHFMSDFNPIQNFIAEVQSFFA
jgi:membrane associated rhomboid family serine protease